jgi:hypothetical protein
VLAEVFFRWRDNKYAFDFQTMTAKEALLLEQVTELKPAQLLADFANGGVRGVLGFLLIALNRAGVDTSWDELLDEPILKLEGGLNETGGDAVDPSTASTRTRSSTGKGRNAKSARSPKS